MRPEPRVFALKFPAFGDTVDALCADVDQPIPRLTEVRLTYPAVSRTKHQIATETGLQTFRWGVDSVKEAVEVLDARNLIPYRLFQDDTRSPKFRWREEYVYCSTCGAVHTEDELRLCTCNPKECAGCFPATHVDSYPLPITRMTVLLWASMGAPLIEQIAELLGETLQAFRLLGFHRPIEAVEWEFGKLSKTSWSRYFDPGVKVYSTGKLSRCSSKGATPIFYTPIQPLVELTRLGVTLRHIDEYSVTLRVGILGR